MKQSRFVLLSKALGLAIIGLSLSSCNIYDDRDGCEQALQLRLVYDYNMKYANAIEHEVKSAHVCAYDGSGNLALDKQTEISDGTVSIDELNNKEKYNFVVWAEGDDYGESYDYGSSADERQRSVRLKRTDGSIDRALTPLFHGREVKHDFALQPTATVSLMKDTKSISVMLQHLNSNNTISADDFTMTITDNNGLLDYENNLAADDSLTYRPCRISTVEASVGDNEQQTKAVLADFTINRIMKEGHSPRLTVRRATGERVLSIPLIDYFLLVKGYYNRSMSDQEYLDRQDEYSLVFFLDDNDNWLSTDIYINSWHVVLSEQDIR